MGNRPEKPLYRSFAEVILGEGQAAHAGFPVRKFCPPRGSEGFKGLEDVTETIPFGDETSVLLLMTEQAGFPVLSTMPHQKQKADYALHPSSYFKILT